MPGSLFVISGPAGAGKGTLVSQVLERADNVWLSISATTRAPRGTEVDGVEYFFYSVEQFERLIEEDGFLEWAQVHGNYYGTPIAPIKQHLEAGDTVILEIDVQGGFQVRKRFPQARLVFIAPPSSEILEQRLRGRGTDSEDSIRLRLANAASEMEASKDYDYVIVNDMLDKATEDVLKVINSHFGQ